MVLLSAQGICQAVVCDVDQQVKVVTAHRFHNHPFRLTRAETGNLCLDDIGVALVSGKCKGTLMLAFALAPPSDKIFVHFVTKLLASPQRDDAQ